MQWYEEFSARFKALSKRDVEVWTEIVNEEINNIRPGELSSAIKLMGEEKRKGKHQYSPTVEDLISAIIKNRWLAKQSSENEGPKHEDCALCRGSGWLSFKASKREQEYRIEEQLSFEDGWYYAIFSVPCLCSMGKVTLKNYKPEDHAEIINLAKQVVEKQRELSQNATQEVNYA